VTRKNMTDDAETAAGLRDEWLSRLDQLAASVKAWVEELDWSTRVISKKMNDSRLGRYEAPSLMMQKEATRVLLDPVARFAPGTEGVVDLYLMPGYDDIATLSFADGAWGLHHLLSGDRVSAAKQMEHRPLTKDTLAQVLNELTAHVPEPL
jgi:hypothetical protein